VFIRDDFVNFRLNFVQVSFQRLCVLELAMGFGFLDEGLQKGFLLKQGLKGMRKLRIWINEGTIDRFGLWRCRI